MTPEEFKAKTKKAAITTIKLANKLPKTPAGFKMADQLIRSGTSVGANYRSACRGRSRAEMVAKLGIVLEEADETLFWLEVLVGSGLCSAAEVRELESEMDEILRMTVASINTMKQKPKG